MRNENWVVSGQESLACRAKSWCGHFLFLVVHSSFIIILLLVWSCSQQPSKPTTTKVEENRDAKAMLQGVWQDAETEEVLFMAEGDTVYFADPTSMPAYFRIVGDSIELGPNTYLISKQTAHNFWFKNHAGDEVQLVKHDEIEDDAEQQPDLSDREPQIISTTQVVNLDSVVMYGGQRYHWYVTVNPTRYRVIRTTYTPDGVAVEKVYYDNIIHVSVFKGNQRLYSRDFNKKDFANNVPQDFLTQSILGNIRFDAVDAKGFHFNATVCIPDGESCYLVETLISLDGQLSLKLLE